MSFPRYPKYKASGIEWLGDVPEGWGVKRLRFVVNLNPSKSEVSALDRETAVSFLPMEAVGDDGTLVLDKEKTIGELETGYTYFRDGDVTIAKITPCYENGKGAIMRGLTNGIGFGTTELIVARPMAAEITSSYLHYLFISPDFRGLGESHMYGAGGQKRVPDAFVRNFATGIPPLPEQTTIAEFLDRETGKIDELVAEQRRLMELLKEKRQAVISHAVTKGLNPHAPMKPSGIEWLGDVPEHWEVKPLRSVFKFSKGLTITKENLQDEGVCCVNYGEIHSKYGFRLNPTIHPLRCVSPEYLSTNPEALIRDGDFVFADTSEDLEGSGNFTHLRSADPIFAGYHTIIARPRKDTYSLLLAYQIHSSVFRSQIQRKVKGVKVFSISQGILKSAKCWLPPLPEQKAIAEFLETELAKFDTLTAEAQRAIDLLQERRTALISAAVTGQIDVRPQPRK